MPSADSVEEALGWLWRLLAWAGIAAQLTGEFMARGVSWDVAVCLARPPLEAAARKGDDACGP